MSLKEVQRTLVELYTNSDFRKQFYENPYENGKKFALNETEINDLLKIPFENLDFFSSTLKSKRIKEVIKLLPKTFNLLDKEFKELFNEYSEKYFPKGIKKHQEDAIGFSDYLLKKMTSRELIVNETIKFEKTFIESFDSKNFFRIKLFKHDIKYNNEKGKFISIWYRLKNGKVKNYYFTLRKEDN